jgi:glycosidase
MTTRFFDGDVSNNVQCWEAKGLNQGDPPWRGDFKGLIDKLDYIKALGFTAIWITPVVENCSGYDYHGYHAMDFSKVDPRYTSDEVDFQTLIDAVHAKGMKLVLDVVLNHTGNFGETHFCPLFKKDYSADLSDMEACLKRAENSKLPNNYDDLTGGAQYQARLARMKNTDGVNHDTNNYWHHFGNFNWDDLTSQWAQIAGDCVDLNTENPLVYNYLVESYSRFIRMGVNAFRIDTGRHISRLVFNKVFNDAFHEVAKTEGHPFFMFAEICTRDRNYWYRNTPAMSTPFYTWKERQSYAWSEDATEFTQQEVFLGTAFSTTNHLSCIAHYKDNQQGAESSQPSSQNAFLQGNNYHTPNYVQHSGLNVIDFPMHWNFEYAGSAFNIARQGDHAYNDATYNVTYVDSHDYAPDGAPEGERFAKPQGVWAENLTLMFTFRGIPCLYYGSEIEFKKGAPIDKGPTMPLRNTGRAYYGGYLKGSIETTGFGTYNNATGNVAVTLRHPLARHIRRLNRIRQSVPALRKGQYSTSGCQGNLAFKRRYTDDLTDSYVLVTISGNATFTDILNGIYTDIVTGDVKNVSNHRLQASCSGQGNARIYVLTTALTTAPGKVGEDGAYLYGASPVLINPGSYPEDPEALTEIPDEPDPVDPVFNEGEQAVFFKRPDSWGSTIYTYIYYKEGGNVHKVTGNWPGKRCENLGNKTYKYILDEGLSEIGSTGSWYLLFSDNAGHQTQGDPGFLAKNGGFYTLEGWQYTITPTGLEVIPYQTDLYPTMQNGVKGLHAAHSMDIKVYDLSGICVAYWHLKEGFNFIPELPKGMYVANHLKWIVR